MAVFCLHEESCLVLCVEFYTARSEEISFDLDIHRWVGRFHCVRDNANIAGTKVPVQWKSTY